LLQKTQLRKKVAVALSHEDLKPIGTSDQMPFGDYPAEEYGQEAAPSVAWVSLGRYPGYTGPSTPPLIGLVNMSAVNGAVALSWSMTGTDDFCNGDGVRAKNGCGLHIHEGTSCLKSADVGGHFYSEDHFLGHNGSDPWEDVVYYSDRRHSVGTTSLVIGKEMRDILGRAFVVHDHSGIRVACGVIKTGPHAKPKSAAPVTGLSLTVFLTMVVTFLLAASESN